MAAKFVEIEGIEKVVKRLLRAEKGIQRNVQRGMKKAGLTLQRLSMQIVPIQTGNLRGSAFTRAHGEGKNFGVIVGYTASYAVFVHENLNAAHGAEFNAKHADKIARAIAGLLDEKGRFRADASKKRSRIWFNRGPNQQAKFLEAPARQNRELLLKIIQKAASKKPKV